MYCSLEQLKAYVGAATANDDSLLTDCIVRAQSVIESVTRRVFECAADSTRTLDAVADVAGRTLYLDADLCQITSITNGDGSAVSPAQIVGEPRNATPYYALTLKGSTGLAWTYTSDPEDAISIVGRWAYSVLPPGDIEQACVRLAGWLYRQKDSSSDLYRPTVSADGATLLPARLPRDIEYLLAAYRRVVVR